jgi:tRNA threonylcarbamoyladenosine biosynthesis protein TsaB
MLLALDTSSDYVSLALFDDSKLLTQIHQSMSSGQAEKLFPLLQELLKAAKATPKDISSVAVAIGPGSFTGVRIGLSTARAFALALNIPVIGITNFDAAIYGIKQPITVALDTKRGDFFVQTFDQDAHALSKPTIQTTEQLAKNTPFFVTGSGALQLSKSINCTYIPFMSPAVAIGYTALTRPDLHYLANPLYLRDANVTI